MWRTVMTGENGSVGHYFLPGWGDFFNVCEGVVREIPGPKAKAHYIMFCRILNKSN